MTVLKTEALAYHSGTRPGKIEITPTKPCRTQRDLSLAYTPGVAQPCLEIQKEPLDAFKYTAKGNLVAVVTNGTAVLGLGNIGALAGKPVMEGKAVLFKRFADVDVFDLEVGSTNPDDVIKVCQLLEPTFGGINLEDIKAPECFYIEETLKKTMKIPVFHDDQHGTAIISGAALLNALEIVGKKIEEVRVVFNGSGAAAIACAEHYIQLGVKRENILMADTKGVIYKGRAEGMNPYKARFARKTELRTLSDALKGADVFAGLSVKGAITGEMLKTMAAKPIVFALANPDPEISYEEAIAARKDAIVATGRSDFPNQVNNVLGFPFIFRGALDVRATAINESMKLAATRALAALAKEDVPDSVCHAYGVERIRFGAEYIIPKPFDPRVLVWEATARGEGGDGIRSGGRTGEPGRVPRAAGTTAGKSARSDASDYSQGAKESAAGGIPGGRERENIARGTHTGGRENRATDSGGKCRSDSREGEGSGCKPGVDPGGGSARLAETRSVCAIAVRIAAAAGRDIE